MITFVAKGSFDHTEAFLRNLTSDAIFSSLNRYGEVGRAALAASTPRDSGETAAAWSYEVVHRGHTWEIQWKNSNVQDGFPVAVMLQYGHGTGTGGYVKGTDYINPAIKPIFDQIAKAVWEEVTRA
jgi:hypothetical protein